MPNFDLHKAIRGSTILFFLMLALLVGSFFRISLLLLYPFIAVLIILHFRLKLTHHFILLSSLLAISTLLALFNGFYWQYHLLSLFHMLPFLLLLFAVPSKDTMQETGLLEKFIMVLAGIALINNIVGFFQYAQYPSDDSFMGLFSHYGISLYALVLLNTVLFAYYFSVYIGSRKKAALAKSLFFLLSSVMGFYGSGLLVLMAAFALSFLTFRLSAVFKIMVISTIVFFTAYYVLSFLRPEALFYYEVSVKRLLAYDKSESPRKLIAHYNYLRTYPQDAKDLLLGSGPGTFNSRSAFMAGSPQMFNAYPFLKTEHQPYYFRNFIYPLWNHNNTSAILYQDGFRNQPFSSVLAFLGEYGLIFSFLLLWSIFEYYKRVKSLVSSPAQKPQKWLFKFLLTFLLLLLGIDNYFEYPETMLVILLVLKLTHIKIAGLSTPPLSKSTVSQLP